MEPVCIDMVVAAALWSAMTWRYGALVRPRWKLLGKTAFYWGISLPLAWMWGHWALIFIIGQPALGFAGHLTMCWRHGINWWTCEPRERYIALQTQWAEKLMQSDSKGSETATPP